MRREKEKEKEREREREKEIVRENGSRLEVHVAPSSRSGHGETRKTEAGADGEVRLRLVARARDTSPWVNTLRDAPLPPPLPSPPTALLPTTTTKATPVYVRSTPRYPPPYRRERTSLLYFLPPSYFRLVPFFRRL